MPHAPDGAVAQTGFTARHHSPGRFLHHARESELLPLWNGIQLAKPEGRPRAREEGNAEVSTVQSGLFTVA